MTTPTLGCDNFVKCGNHFNTVQKPFPDLRDGKIDTEQFIEAAKGVVILVEKLGKLFATVKYDMMGNVEKITKCYQSDITKNRTLHDMVLSEQAEGGNLSTGGLLWFTRALHFMEKFLELILSTTNEDIKKELSQAYSLTVKQYHGWATKKIFLFICEMCPKRSQFLKSLGNDTDTEGFYKDMDAFLQSLRANRIEIHRFYADHKLENNTVV